MNPTVPLKRLLGLGSKATGIERREETVHECTVCATRFDTEESRCPACGSQLRREKTLRPDARRNLLVAFCLAAVGVVYTFLSGKYPREGRED